MASRHPNYLQKIDSLVPRMRRDTRNPAIVLERLIDAGRETAASEAAPAPAPERSSPVGERFPVPVDRPAPAHSLLLSERLTRT